MNKPIHVGLTTGKVLRCITAVILLVLAGWTLNASGQTVTILHSFVGSPSEGVNPLAWLVQGSDGNFYGTTSLGGTTNAGTVFRISPSGTYTTLHSFVGGNSFQFSDSPDGNNPVDGLIQGSDGNFYGTTKLGGTNLVGTVFRISPSGSEAILHNFGAPGDGAGPFAGLIKGSDGNFYGTTSGGGTNLSGVGVVFRISPAGNYSILHFFGDQPNDGLYPLAGLVQGIDGNFYGTTEYGGTNNAGTIFRISPSGDKTVLYFFGGHPADGSNPLGLVQGSDRNFYGATASQIAGGNAGTVFRVSPNGSETVLYSFADFLALPSGLVQGSDGNFYGTTYQGGTYGSGTVFRISPTGMYTNLYSFGSSPNDGAFPNNGESPGPGLVQGTDGSFYGTTALGGTNNLGTVFKLTVPVNPPPYPINQIANAQAAATNIVFNVVSIAGETYQLQFSSSLNPTNWVNVPGVSVTNSIGALLTLTNFGGAVGPQGFYRFDITP